jgi:Uma2 family endonuclease
MDATLSAMPATPLDGVEVGLVVDPLLLAELRERRSRNGTERLDEVWEGVYVLAPSADNEHQGSTTRLSSAILQGLGFDDDTAVVAGANVSDRVRDWSHNYRVHDVAVFLKGTTAVNHGAFWHGGPDFAVEVVSPHDRTREKLDFYAAVGTRELLIVDRDSWRLALLRLAEGSLVSVGDSTVEGGEEVASAVLPFTFRLVAGESRPRIAVRHESGQVWNV